MSGEGMGEPQEKESLDAQSCLGKECGWIAGKGIIGNTLLSG